MQPIARWLGRTAVLATMHGKEQAIAPPFYERLRMTVTPVPNFNTDGFGTFTREVPRPDSQRATARQKAQKALAVTGHDLALASEGAFMPHPALPMLACDRELILLLDGRQDLEIAGEVVSTDTNFAQATVRSHEEAFAFAQKVGFPEHGLVVMPTATPNQPEALFKGITDLAQLIAALDACQPRSPDGSVHLETDMRAMVNPTRMDVIRQAAQVLIDNMLRPCPRCQRPGFVEVDRIPGLPCDVCGLPTALTRASVYQCAGCDYRREQPFPEGRETANPGQCSFCNP